MVFCQCQALFLLSFEVVCAVACRLELLRVRLCVVVATLCFVDVDVTSSRKEAQMYDSGPIMLGHIADGEKENPTPSHLDEDLQHKLAVQFSQAPWRGSLASSSGTHTGRSSQQSLSETFGSVDRDKSYRIRRTSQVEAAFRMNKAYHLETKRIRQDYQDVGEIASRGVC